MLIGVSCTVDARFSAVTTISARPDWEVLSDAEVSAAVAVVAAVAARPTMNKMSAEPACIVLTPRLCSVCVLFVLAVAADFLASPSLN
jgi:hypothetical protein